MSKRKIQKKGRPRLIQIRRPHPTEIDDEIEILDFSKLLTSTSDIDAEIIELNKGLDIQEQPIR